MTILKQNWSQIYSKLLNVALGGLCPPKPPTRLCPCTTEPLPRWNNIVSYAPVIVLFCYLYMCNIFTKSYKVILHQFWVKNFFPWKFNLEYGGTFTKLFMHVSSRIMFPTTRNLQIRVHVYRSRHCCGDWLTFGCFVPMIADHDLVKKCFGPMNADHDLVKKR